MTQRHKAQGSRHERHWSRGGTRSFKAEAAEKSLKEM